MDADPIILSVRRRLRDDIDPGRAGVFWSDEEVLLAINAAQDIVVSRLVSIGQIAPLSRLRRRLELTTATPAALPPDYLHAISARVLDPEPRPCRLLVGAPGLHFAARHTAYVAHISGQFVTVHAKPGETVPAELIYLARPAPILSAQDPDFDPRLDVSRTLYQAVEEAAIFLAALKATDTRLAARAHGRTKHVLLRAAHEGGLMEIRR